MTPLARRARRFAFAVTTSGNCSGTRRGLSLVEVSISTLIVGLMLVASLKSVGGVVRTWTATAEQYDGVLLAEQLLAEAVQAHYEEPDSAVGFGIESPEVTSVRSAWDDVDDYSALAASPPVDRAGTVIAGLTGWTRACSVRLAAIDDPAATPASDEGLKLITVTVTAPDGRTIVREALRFRHGALEHEALVDGTWVTSVDLLLTTGSGASVKAGVSLPNAPEDN